MRKGLNIAENDRQAARLVGRADLIDADQSELGNDPDAFADFRRVADLAIKDLADSIECDLLDDVALDNTQASLIAPPQNKLITSPLNQHAPVNALCRPSFVIRRMLRVFTCVVPEVNADLDRVSGMMRGRNADES